METSQVALITGASGGLGSIVTPMFRAAGYRVSAVALDWKNPSAAADSELVLEADLTSRSEADSVVAKTIAQFGRIDFLIHLVGVYIRGASVEDTTDETQAKMREYMENGAQLGWLLHIAKRTAYIYRPDRAVEQLVAPKKLAGEGPVKGFVLDLRKIWDTPW